MNNLIFRVFLPILLFCNVYNTDVLSEVNWWTLIFAAGAVTLLFVLLFLTIPFTVKDNPTRATLIQGIGRSNYALFGIPLAHLMFEGAADGIVALLVAAVVPVFNVLSVITLEVFRGGKVNAKKIVTGILKNPLIIATVLGLALMLTGLKLPKILMTPITDLSKIASPFSLFVWAAHLSFPKSPAT
jgi:predicted permease